MKNKSVEKVYGFTKEPFASLTPYIEKSQDVGM
jgi:hypothetical protein